MFKTILMMTSMFIYFTSNVIAIELPIKYNEATALDKQEFLWSLNVNSKYPDGSLPTKGPGFFQMLKVFNAKFLSRTFIDQEDVLINGRKKLVHPLGTVAKATFIPADAHPFGGLYQKETHLLIRISQATASNVTPGIAVKYFRDGKKSLNVVAMKGLDAVAPNCDPFAFAFSNIIAKPTGGMFKTLLNKFQKGLELAKGKGLDATNLKVSHLAKENGVQYAYPYELTFRPSRAARIKTNFSCDYDWRRSITELTAGETIYHVLGNLKKGSKPIYIGKIVLESEFVASKFGDQELFFEHFSEK